jgi:hypothetical protein
LLLHAGSTGESTVPANASESRKTTAPRKGSP